MITSSGVEMLDVKCFSSSMEWQSQSGGTRQEYILSWNRYSSIFCHETRYIFFLNLSWNRVHFLAKSPYSATSSRWGICESEESVKIEFSFGSCYREYDWITADVLIDLAQIYLTFYQFFKNICQLGWLFPNFQIFLFCQSQLIFKCFCSVQRQLRR